MLLFLDFDGVLHRWPHLRRRRETARLFNHVPALYGAIKDTPVNIVISSSWRLGFDWRQLLEFIGPLGPRVVATTGREDGTRYSEIAARLVNQRYEGPWLAIDDDDVGWPAQLRDRLVKVNGVTGIRESDLSRLRSQLACCPRDTHFDRQRLILNRALAAQLPAEGPRLLGAAKQLISAWRTLPDLRCPDLDTWAAVVDDGDIESIQKILTGSGNNSFRLRLSSPFSVQLESHERSQILRNAEADRT